MSIHDNADPATAELSQRIIVSVHQLSIHGAVADWCQELARGCIDPDQITDVSKTFQKIFE